jgi:hypothetical protein
MRCLFTLQHPAVNKELLLLHSILGDILHRAIEILDSSTIKLFTSVASGRGIFEISGKDQLDLKSSLLTLI